MLARRLTTILPEMTLPGNRSRSIVFVISMICRFIGSPISAIFGKIVIATYCFKKGYTT
jgi:hypothetical protein